MASKIELAVQMTCESCVEQIKNCFEDVEGVKNVEVNLKNGSVVMETTISTTSILEMLESTGRRAVVKGYGGSLAGVAILECSDKNVQGVIRFMQIGKDICLIDGTVDGLNPGLHPLHIHECGDLSDGCENVGLLYISSYTKKVNDEKNPADLGNVMANHDGRATFRSTHQSLVVSDLIGRSIVIKELEGKKIACGIIARSSGLFENPKIICACDGISIWDERNKPKFVL